MFTQAVFTTIDDFFAAIEANDVDAWLATLADDAISQEPTSEISIEGQAAHREFFHSLMSSFEWLAFTMNHAYMTGSRAAVKWTAYGVTRDDLEAIFEGIHVFHINNEGKIQGVEGYWDPAMVMAPLHF